MASDNNSSSVAIVAILILVLLGGFVAWRMGAFGGGGDGTGDDKGLIDVDVNR